MEIGNREIVSISEYLLRHPDVPQHICDIYVKKKGVPCSWGFRGLIASQPDPVPLPGKVCAAAGMSSHTWSTASSAPPHQGGGGGVGEGGGGGRGGGGGPPHQGGGMFTRRGAHLPPRGIPPPPRFITGKLQGGWGAQKAAAQ